MHNYIQFIKKNIYNHKRMFLQSFIFIFFLIGIRALLPISMRWIITSVSQRNSTLFLIKCIAIYSLFLLILNCSDVAWMKFLDKLGGKIIGDLRNDLYRALISANYEDILSLGKEKIKNILYMDTLNIFSSIACFSIQILVNSFLLIVFLIISSYINSTLTLVLFIASIIGFLISMFSRKPISNASMKVNVQMKEDNKILNECVDTIELSKTNSLESYFSFKMKNSLGNFINTSIKSDNILVFLKNLITEFHQIVSLSIAAVLSMTMGNTSTGDLVYYLFVSDMVLETSQNIENNIYSLIKIMPSFNNVNKILMLKKNNPSKIINNIETIEFRNVSFYYKISNKIINNKSIVFQKGDLIKISGLNGGGKSTFVKLIKGLLHPKEGNIFINGISITDISLDHLNKEILYIDQDENLLNDNLKTYLETISGKKISDKELFELKKKVNLDDEIDSISSNGKSLSGGQRKKLLMLKLILNYSLASVIILDEIEAGLDSNSRDILLNIEKQIIKEKKDCIFFKISHDTNNDITYTKYIDI